jgi:hypothetical protein
MKTSVVATILLLALASAWSQFQPAQAPARRGPAPGAARREPFLSVVDFGAHPNDNRPDSDAIQRAIDSLPRPAGPGDKVPSGGVVAIPGGQYLLDKPLRISSGVTLRGEGAGTVLYMPAPRPPGRADAPTAAILLVSPFTHRYIASAVIEDLSIYTDTARGIAVDPSATQTVQCRFENLIISPGGCAIDLDEKQAQKNYTQNTIVRNIHVSRPGGAALTLWGNANHIDQINTEGGTRDGFRAEPAIVTVSGAGNDIRGCIIEAVQPNPAVAFHVSGGFTWQHNWVELSHMNDGIAYIFKDVEGAQIDYLHHILPHHKARFINCHAVHIRSLNLNGEMSGLAQNIELDEKSNLLIDQVIARTDAGMLDDPRVSIGSVYNMIGKYRVDLPLSGQAVPLLSAEEARVAADGWTAQWEHARGPIKGSLRLEDQPNGNGKRLRVEVIENPQKRPLGVEKVLDALPPQLAGTRCIVTWRLEGTGQMLVNYAGQQIPSRVMGSLTANPLPVPLKRGEMLQFVIPPEPGVYYISDVALYPAR